MDADYLIIGGGVAGICLAKKLAKQSRVIICESGHLQDQPKINELNDYSNDTPYAVLPTRVRQFGGTSNIWVGSSRPHDYHFSPDFPLDLSIHIPETERILKVPSPERYSKPSPVTGYDEIYFNSSQKRFNEDYQDLSNNPNIAIYLNHTLVDIAYEKLGAATRITGCTFKDSLSGEKIQTLKANKVVLCAGGLRNARLPMLFNQSHKLSIGGAKHKKFLGKYFTDHIFLSPFGSYITTSSLFQGGYKHQPEHYSKLFRSVDFGDSPLMMDICFNKPSSYVPTEEEKQDELLARNIKRIQSASKDKSLVSGQVWFVAGMRSDQKNGITISSKRDALNMPKIAMDFNWDSKEISNEIRRQLYIFGEKLVVSGLGLLRLPEEYDVVNVTEKNCSYGSHHQGTTRMAMDENLGCVGYDFCFFGTENLYTVGSSLYYSTGLSNPTFTIIALALEFARQQQAA